MSTKKFMVMIGAPGCGKSTWASNYAKESMNKVCIVSRDQIRFDMLNDDEEYFAHEDAVFKAYVRQLNKAIALGIDEVIADATHLTAGSRNKLLSQIKHDKDVELVYVYVEADLETCIERNRKREGREKVPRDTVINMYHYKCVPRLDGVELSKNPHGFKKVSLEVVTA